MSQPPARRRRGMREGGSVDGGRARAVGCPEGWPPAAAVRARRRLAAVCSCATWRATIPAGGAVGTGAATGRWWGVRRGHTPSTPAAPARPPPVQVGAGVACCRGGRLGSAWSGWAVPRVACRALDGHGWLLQCIVVGGGDEGGGRCRQAVEVRACRCGRGEDVGRCRGRRIARLGAAVRARCGWWPSRCTPKALQVGGPRDPCQ